MTKSFVLAFAALALSAGAALASPAAALANRIANPAAHGDSVVSAPEVGFYGSRALPVFNYNDPAVDPGTISTPYTVGHVGSQQVPVFNYRGAAPLTARTGGTNCQSWKAMLFPSTTCLVLQTGGGH